MGALTLFQRMGVAKGFVDPSQSVFNVTGPPAPNQPTDPVFLVFDTIETEENEMENIGTTNPIETGAFVSDHIRSMPEKANFKATISQAYLGGFFGSSRGPLLQNSNDPIKDAYNYLHDKIFKAKAVCDFVGNLKVYQTYFMSSLKINIDQTTSMALSCSFTIQQLIIVNTQVVDAPAIAPQPSTTAPSTATPPESLGQQSPVTTTPPQQAENTELMNILSPAIGSQFGAVQ